ncbi:D-alanine--D-alanine ligase [Thermosyntropha lipolytica DSM 11003]|uniref:D-alanine--D-alanine ligase n=1 Tax=Thermosyntropha lipolytica DSM 11003 TaxID=1123382 RepID=A0A1M5L9Y0_9FIRM|nr:D-alanine--D-alanine ligase [Thermosyntropha lipolytica]SHG61770.1 D-alanine--D-alanine ligase [Thermosyntropha lipolytica DSM 11003]
MVKVLVLYGGTSSEREISLKSGKAVAEGLKKAGYAVEVLDVNKDNLAEISRIKPDVVFNALHGKYGEDGRMQAYLDLLGIPYTGSGMTASIIGMNKILTKKILTCENIPTAEYVVIKRKGFVPEDVSSIMDKLGCPLVVKAPTQGSSIGTHIVKNAEALREAINDAFNYDDEVLVEKFIAGTEVTAALLGNEDPVVLPIIEITSANEFYDYQSKYTPGMCQHIIPARITKKAETKVREISSKVYKAVGCRGFARIDFIVDKDDQPWVLEINTIPGMTEMSLVPDAARAAGMSFEELVDRIVKLALQ